jgi:protein phosphatase
LADESSVDGRERPLAGKRRQLGDGTSYSMIALNWGTASDTGLVRQRNEDSLLAALPVFAVADGMGGHAAGDVASALTIGLLRELTTHAPLSADELKNAIEAANNAVISKSSSSEAMRGMGTTLVGIALVGGEGDERWMAFNVGDSRLYRLADGSLTQVSRDHSEVQELLDEGAISESEARRSPVRNVVTRAIGTSETLDVDYWMLDPEPGERFMICSDGLTSELTKDQMIVTLLESPDPAMAANRLVEQALAAGGHDNVSVIVVDVSNTAPPER